MPPSRAGKSAGETWQVYLDTKTLMPAVVVAFRSSGGELIERYTYKNLKSNLAELADAAAFDPDSAGVSRRAGCRGSHARRQLPRRRPEARPRHDDCQIDGKRGKSGMTLTAGSLLFRCQVRTGLAITCYN